MGGHWANDQHAGNILSSPTILSSPPPPPPPPPSFDHAPLLARLSSPPSPASVQEHRLSPELARLPPRTPATFRSRDTSSDYYTALWGSPYALSPSPSRSAHTALSEHVPSDGLEDHSSEPGFGLDHLIPARLPALIFPHQGLSPLRRFDPITGSADDTPRARTKQWVQLPQREESSPERVHWFSDDSDQSGSEAHQREERPASQIVPPRQQKAGGHRPRKSNRTLDQQSFWDILREEKPTRMSSLLDSRWAATPPPEGGNQRNGPGVEARKNGTEEVENQDPAVEVAEESGNTSGALNGKTAKKAKPIAETATVEPEELPDHGKPQDTPGEVHSAPTSSIPVVATPLAATSSERHEPAAPSEHQQASDAMRLEPPRLKKRVSWRGKNIVIMIPQFNFEAAGLSLPLTDAEVQDRLQRFEQAGYGVAHEGIDKSAIQVRPLYPDDAETRTLPSADQIKVVLPDLEKWRAYTDWLVERKLAALGVSTGLDEPALAPARAMSRQSSGQYPSMPFSPPIPTASQGSMSRPSMIRGHSHTMSVASPTSPLNSPFGHMHRHSTFSGPISFSPQQSQPPHIPGIPSFSHQPQFAVSGLPQGASPAQFSGLRNGFYPARGPGSPLSHQILQQTPQDYSRGMVEDQRRRQHGHSQSMYQPVMPNTLVAQGFGARQTPALQEVREDEDDEELEEPDPVPMPGVPAYVPPHSRSTINTDIAVPTPRGHHHNISEGLERDLLAVEERHQLARRDWIEVTEETDSSSAPDNMRRANGVPRPQASDRNAPGQSVLQDKGHDRKASGTRFNVAAPAFTFNPGASFQPKSAAFGSGAPNPQQSKAAGKDASSHNRQQSSGSFNVAAPAFKPANSNFSFSAAGPGFMPGAPSFQPLRPVNGSSGSIFGTVNIPEIVKPARRSKAVAIVRPEESQSADSGTDFEDEEGRVTQGNVKRQRNVGGDGDEVPRFAEPTPVSTVVAPQPASSSATTLEKSATANGVIREDLDEAPNEPVPQDTRSEKADTVEGRPRFAPSPEKPAQKAHMHSHSTSLSALAKPFEPSFVLHANDETQDQDHEQYISISELEEGEIRSDGSETVSPVQRPGGPTDHDRRPDASRPRSLERYASSERIVSVAQAEPSFDEIDAVMRQLNAEDPDDGRCSPMPPSPGPHPMQGVTHIANWSRSDAPSPSPGRKQRAAVAQSGTRNGTDSGDQAANGWPQIHRLNKTNDVPTSDWSDVLSPPDESKLQERSRFFDSHIDNIIGRVVEQRLQPLEESLRTIQSTVSQRNRSDELPLIRSSPYLDSDADDEDDVPDDRRQRPVSRGRDKRVDAIKAAVLEALREQSLRRSQSSIDAVEMHAVLADMKASFARAVSTSLELDDIRVVVDDAIHRQSQAVVLIAIEGRELHKRELSALEGRLNETLAGALEEANHRHAVEEREAETRRMLRSAEEELRVLRESSRAEGSELRAMQEERGGLLDRLEKAEDVRHTAQEKLEDVEETNLALEATLAEYRMSSNQWRHKIDEAKRERESLEKHISLLEGQVEDSHDTSRGMKCRLESLHADLVTAVGLLATEKASWKLQDTDLRSRIKVLEAGEASHIMARAQLETHLSEARSEVTAAADSRQASESLRTAKVLSEETIRGLQSDLAEQQALAIRYKRQFHDAQESGRAEVHRTRVTLETEVEAANHKVNLVRAEYDAELMRVRAEVESAKMEAETAKARHDHRLEEEEDVRREALRKVNHSSSVALDDARSRYETALQDVTAQHARALRHAVEDKDRSEDMLNQRLALSDDKAKHLQERVVHLEERLEVAKSAAQAAVLRAQGSKYVAAQGSSNDVPDKVSPQALRESILVLQEQLQEREQRIELLRTEVEGESAAKLKERDTEITWLRELLAVRGEELGELINTLSRPAFNRDAVRDTAIRIRANLQMEQQEKERLVQAPSASTLGGQALASLSSFATPKATQLFSKWRSTMESSALRAQSRPGMPARSFTPSRPTSSTRPPTFPSGLMTPPASNLRSSPLPEESKSVSPPRLHSRTGSRGTSTALADARRPTAAMTEQPATPLLQKQTYDQDAEDSDIRMQSFEDDDLDVADSAPPAFRSLEAELEEPTMAGADFDD